MSLQWPFFLCFINERHEKWIESVERHLEFLTVAQVATVAKAGHYVFMLVHARVDGGTPDH